MADTSYKPLPYLYKSVGLHAREAYDRCPEYSYIFLMNGLERDEESMSSRFGYLIVNRDPDGTPGGQNYFFNFPITSIAKMYFQGNPQRYVGLGDGSLWQRNSNTQGQFSEIHTGLSGNPFDTLIASCYATALPFLFIYDEDGSIKIAAGSSTVNLTGIDPPPYTANSVPYAPLLTLIDAFTASNSYSTSDVSDWGFAPIESLLATSGQQVTDFTEFFGIYQGGGSSYTPTSEGAEVTATASGGMDTETSTPVLGFPSVPITVGEVVTVSVLLQGSEEISGGAEGGGQGTLNFQYSVDSGATWYTFYTWYGPSLPSGESATLPPTTQSIIINAPGALGNLATVQLQIVAIANADGDPSPVCTTFGEILLTSAVVTAPGIFGIVAPGMLSVFDSASSTSIPIASIESTDFVSEVYLGLLITTSVPHGFDPSASNYISVYGSSNDLVDGYYPIQQVTGSNSFIVPYDVAPGGSPIIGSPLFINATGGFVHGGASMPPCCVLQNQFSTPYPSQMSAWGFYQQVPVSTTAFPISSWSGTVASNATGVIGAYAGLDLSINKQVTDSDLIVLVLAVGSPANIANIRLQFDVDGSGYTSAYYYANIAPSYYQGNIANIQDAYQTTQNQILADALGLLTGQPESSTTAQLQPSNISTGAGSWVAVLIPRGNFLPVGNAGQAGLDWSNITGWQIVIETTATPITGDGSSSIACNGLYLQWGYGPSSFAGVGYDWRYTYYNLATGTESSPSGEQEYNQQYGYLSSLSAPFYLRQAAQIGGYYSSDPQVTHYRVYRRGGIYANNWLLIDQVQNITAGGQFLYKDVVPDASLAQAQPLVLDNDPPVTSSLVTPILTSLAVATTGPGSSFYSTYMPQLITVVDDTAVFVPTQVVLLGNAYNLEEVLVVEGGTGQFTAIVRLQHNAGEQVQVNSTPRTFCNLCCTVNLPGGATQVLVAGDKTNPHRVYYAKPGQPENFGPENYVDSSSPDDPVMALINWRGTGLVATQNTWYIFVGGAQPYLQPTGAAHGMIAEQGWCLVEGEIAFRSQDGWRFFSGADGKYMTLPVEWIFRTNPDCLPPQAAPLDASQDVFAYYNNLVIGSYVSLDDGIRYRLIYDTVYSRYRQDDIAATAMLWERDTNLLLCGVPIGSASNTIGYALVEDQQYNQDYDDGGWNSGSLVQVPVNIQIQLPYKDVGKPHFPKQFNVLETDANTQGQSLETTLYFNTEPETSIVLPTVNSGTVREKLQQKINAGDGQQAYAMSIKHTMAVTVAPTLFQENVYAAILADYRTSFDSYWQKAGSNELKLWKEGYFDYSATGEVMFSLYANGDMDNPYFEFTLPIQADRTDVRVLFPALKCRLWRMVGISAGDFQLWSPVTIDSKPLLEGSGYERVPYGVYE